MGPELRQREVGAFRLREGTTVEQEIRISSSLHNLKTFSPLCMSFSSLMAIVSYPAATARSCCQASPQVSSTPATGRGSPAEPIT